MPTRELDSINSQSMFFENFSRTSFIGKTAKWAHFFAYGFIFFQIGSILVQQIFPFSVSPPDLFLQLLFLLILWGLVEVLTIFLDACSDVATVDYEHHWISLVQKRFIFTRVKILASFNQIMAIGVTCRPEAMSSKYFSDSPDRYALVIQNFNQKLIRITDFNLSQVEANNFVNRFHSSHLPGARIFLAEANMELFLDSVTGEICRRPCQRSWLTLVDAFTIPIFQSMLSFVLVYFFIWGSFTILNSISIKVFSTNLKIRKQPIIQLISGSDGLYEDSEVCNLPGPEGPAPSLPIADKENPPLVLTTSTSNQSGVSIDFSNQKIETSGLLPNNKASQTSIITDTQSISSESSILVSKISTDTNSNLKSEPVETGKSFSEVIANSILQTSSATTTVNNQAPDTNETQSESNKKIASEKQTIVIAENLNEKIEPKIKENDSQKIIKNALNEENSSFDEGKYQPAEIPPVAKARPKAIKLRIDPIIAGVPDVNLESFVKNTSSSNSTTNSNKKIKTEKEEILKTDVIDPISTEIEKPKKPSVDTDPAKSRPALAKTFNPAAFKTLQTSILPGFGIHSISAIGDTAAGAIKKLGQPIFRQKAQTEWQIIYPDFTIIATLKKLERVKRINITKRKSQKFGLLSTPQGISVGSPMEQVRAKYGAATLKDLYPGLHFPSMGISFIPSPTSPETVGAIEIYKPEKKIRN